MTAPDPPPSRLRLRLRRVGKYDEEAYAKVMDELQRSGPIPGLWAKAFAEADGDERISKAKYLQLRVAQLVRLEKEAATQAVIEAREAARLQRNRDVGSSYTMLYLVVGLLVVVTALTGILVSIYI